MSDFFRPVILSSKMDNSSIAAVQQMLIRAQQAMPWLPNLTGEAVSVMYGSPPRFPQVNSEPEGLTEEQQQQWDLFRSAFQEVARPVLRGNMKDALQAAQAAQQNEQLWDNIQRVTTAVATVGFSELAPIVVEKWNELKANIKEFNTTRKWALDIAAHPQCPPDKAAQIRQRIAELDSTISAKIASATTEIPGIKDSLKHEGLSGAGPLMALASVKTAVAIAVVVAITGVVVYCISSIKTIINDLGLKALGETVNAAQKALGPWLGIGIFGLIGLIIYKKFTKKS